MYESKKVWLKSLLGIVGIVMVFSSLTAAADGTHGSKITVDNDGCNNMVVLTFNGNDKICVAHHKRYDIGKNEKGVTVKCHGNATGRCKLNIKTAGNFLDLLPEDQPMSAYVYKQCWAVDKGGTVKLESADGDRHPNGKDCDISKSD